MKRFVLGLLMLGGLAFVAAPAHAGFDLNLECKHSYAIEMHGTEPELTADQPVHYIAGVGQLTLGAEPSSGPGSGIGGTCPITSGELVYSDNDIIGFSAGPAACYLAQSLLGGGIPCFDGASHITGSFAGGIDGGGVLSMVASFGWIDGSPGAASLPLQFNMQTNFGSQVMGTTVSDLGPTPTSPPPGSPVLVLTMQSQSTTVSLPVTGPQPCGAGIPPAYLPTGPLPCTGGGGNGYGVAPYVGLSVSLFQGFGATSGDPFSQPVQDSFGATISSLQIFTNGQSGGSVSFNSNDDVGNTTGVSNNDCDVTVTQTGNFADGASNNAAAILHPSLTCRDAAPAALATFELSNVLWGATDTNFFSMVTGLSSVALTSGLIIPAGLMSDANGISSVPAGGLTDLVSSSMISLNGAPTPNNLAYISYFSTTPAGCDVTASMPTSTVTNGTSGHSCTLSLNGGSPLSFIVEGDTFGSPNPFVAYAHPSCTCTGANGDTTATSTLTLTYPDCPAATATFASGGTISCKN